MPDALGTGDALERVVGDAPRKRVRAAVWWLGLGASGLLAAALTLLVYLEGLPAVFARVPQLDKALHFAMAGVLTFFLDGALRRRMFRIAGVGVAVPLAAVLFLVPAGMEEFLQRYSVNRSSSFGDFGADLAGVAFFIWLSRRIER